MSVEQPYLPRSRPRHRWRFRDGSPTACERCQVLKSEWLRWREMGVRWGRDECRGWTK